MSFVTPMISGASLFGFALLSVFLNVQIQTPVMLLLALGAVLICLPAIKKFQFTKEGFSIEAAEPRQTTRTQSSGTDEAALDKRIARPETVPADNINLRTVRPAMGLFYGTISGVLSAGLGLTYFQFDASTDFQVTSLWPAPPFPALFYSAALFGLLVRSQSIDRIQLLLIPLAVYVAWIAGFRVAFFLGPSSLHYSPIICGLAGGLVGGLLLTLGLSVIAKELRSVAAIFATAIVGGAAGALLGLPSPHIASYEPFAFPVFVGWQGAVSLCIGFFMTSRHEKLALKTT